MKNVFLNRAVWMAGISAIALLSACGGGGSGTPSEATGAEALDVKNTAVWVGDSAVNSISLSRVDGNSVAANTVVQISEWTCATKGEKPAAGSEVAQEVVTTAGNAVVFNDLRLPATKLLVRVMNGNSPYYPEAASVYYAKLHDMVTAGNSTGNLAISFDAVPDSDEKLAAQFDTCP